MPAERRDRPLTVATDWIEAHCVIPDGFRKGEPFRLYDVQLRYLLNFYLVRAATPWLPDNPIMAPAFVHRRALFIGPQKLGKNPLIAAQCTLEAVGPSLFAGWAGNDGYSCADEGCACGWEYPTRGASRWAWRARPRSSRSQRSPRTPPTTPTARCGR